MNKVRLVEVFQSEGPGFTPDEIELLTVLLSQHGKKYVRKGSGVDINQLQNKLQTHFNSTW